MSRGAFLSPLRGSRTWRKKVFFFCLSFFLSLLESLERAIGSMGMTQRKGERERERERERESSGIRKSFLVEKFTEGKMCRTGHENKVTMKIDR